MSANRAFDNDIKPILAIVDPDNIKRHNPKFGLHSTHTITVCLEMWPSTLDLMFCATLWKVIRLFLITRLLLESFTTISPKSSATLSRFQTNQRRLESGSIGDHRKILPSQCFCMLLASTFAGVGFGKAGIHLCHGLSYPISSQGKLCFDKDYPDTKPLIPHGLSVVTTAVADFEFLASSCPERHAQAARQLGADIPENSSSSYIASKLCNEIRGFMQDFGVPNGLRALGFQFSDIDKLSTAAVSVVNIAITPKPTDREIISKIYEKSLKVY